MNRKLGMARNRARPGLAHAASLTAEAQTYPNRPVKIIVPTPAGGPVDVMARLVANQITPALGQTVFIDNRGGAANTLGSAEAARATPDGYTLLYSSASGLVIAPMLQKNAGYDPIKSYDPIAIVAATSNILVVHPSMPAKSVQELVAYAKANPGKINFSSAASAPLPHLIGEYFKAHAGIDVVHVPYRGGGPSIQDVVAGNIQYTFEGISVLLPLIQDGRLRALAVTSPEAQPAAARRADHDRKRLCRFPVDELDRAAGAARHAARDHRQAQRRRERGAQDAGDEGRARQARGRRAWRAPAELTKVIASDIGKWGPIVKALNLQTE